MLDEKVIQVDPVTAEPTVDPAATPAPEVDPEPTVTPAPEPAPQVEPVVEDAAELMRKLSAANAEAASYRVKNKALEAANAETQAVAAKQKRDVELANMEEIDRAKAQLADKEAEAQAFREYTIKQSKVDAIQNAALAADVPPKNIAVLMKLADPEVVEVDSFGNANTVGAEEHVAGLIERHEFLKPAPEPPPVQRVNFGPTANPAPGTAGRNLIRGNDSEEDLRKISEGWLSPKTVPDTIGKYLDLWHKTPEMRDGSVFKPDDTKIQGG